MIVKIITSVSVIKLIKRIMTQKKGKMKIPHFANSLNSTIDSSPDCFYKSFEYRRKTFYKLSRDF